MTVRADIHWHNDIDSIHYQTGEESTLSILTEPNARNYTDRYEEESKEETKDGEYDELFARSWTTSNRERFEESKEETKEQDFDDEDDHGFQPCLDYYEEDVDLATMNSGSSNFRIVPYEERNPPMVTWIIHSLYDSWHDVRFKLQTPEGAYMLLFADEIIDCVLILINDDDGSAYFQIEDLHGNILFADCDQVEAHILYIISTETRKRQASGEQDIFSFQHVKAKRRRKYSGRLVSGVRKLSEIFKQRRSSSQSG